MNSRVNRADVVSTLMELEDVKRNVLDDFAKSYERQDKYTGLFRWPLP